MKLVKFQTDPALLDYNQISVIVKTDRTKSDYCSDYFSYLPVKFDTDFIDDGNDDAPIDDLLDADGCFGVTVKNELIEKSEDEPEPEVVKVESGKRKIKKRKK